MPEVVPAGDAAGVAQLRRAGAGRVQRGRRPRAEALLADADQYSATSTKFVLIAVLLALVLFFASVATKFGNPKLQVLLTAVALGLLAFGILRVLFLPNTF